MIRRFLTLRFNLRPTSETSNSYQLAIWYDHDDLMAVQFVTYPDRKRAEREVLHCITAEAEAYLDDCETEYREALWRKVKAATSLDELSDLL